MKTILAILGVLGAVVFAIFKGMNTSTEYNNVPTTSTSNSSGGGIFNPNKNTPNTPGGTGNYIPPNGNGNDTTTKGGYATPPPANAEWMVVPYEQVGLINKVSTESDIIASCGAKNVTREIVGREWGETIPATLIYADTPDQLTIEWKEGQAYERIEKVRIDGEGTKWQTAEGIHIGMPLSELIRINGTDFKFYGFEWDYSGMVTDWNGGRIKEGTIVFLTPDNPAAAIPAMLGDSLYSTTMHKAHEAQLFVSSIEIKM